MTIRPVANPIRLVQHEIGQSLEQAATLLDAFDQHPEEVPPWERCRDRLEEVHGALVMLDMPGATSLAAECLALVNALENDTVSARDEALNLLVYGLLIIPRHLEQVRYTGREYPETLLPTLNAMRAMRRDIPLPDYHFVQPAPGVSPELPALSDPTPTAPGTPDRERVQRLRHMYQIGLLGLFRAPDSGIHRKQLHRALSRLRDAYGDSATGRWLRLAAILAGLVATRQLPVDTSLRLMLSRLDIHLRECLRSASAGPPPPLLRRALLYYATVYEESDTELQALCATLGLTGSLIPMAVIERERQAISAPDQSVMQAVGAAMAEDLERLKATIETLSRLSSVTTSEREDLCNQLSVLGHTMTLLGLSEAAARLKRENTRLQSAGSDITAERLWELLQSTAEALTLAEECVDSLASGPSRESGQNRSEGLRDAEYHAITECLTNLARVRQAMEFLNGDVDEGEDLTATDVPLREMSGILHVMGRDRPASLIHRAREQLARLTPEHEGSEELATLADALAAVEWYLECLLEDAHGGEEALDIGENALNMLERGLGIASGTVNQSVT